MKKGIIGKKIGMTQIFDEVGNVFPVTVVEAVPCVIRRMWLPHLLTAPVYPCPFVIPVTSTFSP